MPVKTLKVKTLLKSKKHWTQGSFARGKSGLKVRNVQSRYAVSFCLAGAIWRCYGKDPEAKERAEIKLWTAIRKYAGVRLPIVVWNDLETTTFKDVKAVLKIADI